MLRATVPEAAAHIHGDLRGSEHYVDGSAKIVQTAPMHPKTKSTAMELPPERDFGLGVASLLTAHPIPNGFGGCRRSRRCVHAYSFAPDLAQCRRRLARAQSDCSGQLSQSVRLVGQSERESSTKPAIAYGAVSPPPTSLAMAIRPSVPRFTSLTG